MFPKKFKSYTYLSIPNFHVILYLYWVLLFFVVIDFILYFILRDFVVVCNEQNVFEAAQLDFPVVFYDILRRKIKE